MLWWLFAWLLRSNGGQKKTIWPIWLSFKAIEEVWNCPSFFHASADDAVAFFRHSRSFCLIICKFSICIVRYCMFPRILCQCFIDHGYFWNKLPAYSAYFQYDRACFLHIMSKSIDFIFKCMEYNVQWEMQG